MNTETNTTRTARTKAEQIADIFDKMTIREHRDFLPWLKKHRPTLHHLIMNGHEEGRAREESAL